MFGMANGESQGPATDRHNEPVVDPTQNVLDLVGAAIQRQDDLRKAESRHNRELAEQRARYEDKLRDKESQRIDAIRAVDVGNVQRTAEVQATQALTLATQVTTSADALRASQAATALAQDAKLQTLLEPIQKRIDDLTRAQYEQQGQKAQVTEHRGQSDNTRTNIQLGIYAALAVLAIITFFLGQTTNGK